MPKATFWLVFILAIAFLARIAGISYGLPMWLVSDEPPFVFGALKMLELRTLIPAFHAADFASGLYFPPYLSYIYLLFFVPILGIKFLFFSGTLAQFVDVVTLDPSTLFLAGRFISALLGTATVWLVYKTARRVFSAEAPALLAAAFLALSFLHVNFSHWARHWVPATFFFALVMYVLAREDMNARKRYLIASLIAGLGVGVNYQAGLSALFIALWFVFYDRFLDSSPRSGRGQAFRWNDKSHDQLSDSGLRGNDRKYFWVYGCAALFIGLVAFAYVLYPQGLVVHKENVVGVTRSVAGFLSGYWFYAGKLIETEPAFLVFIITGFIALFFRVRRYFWTASLFAFAYVAIFYLFFFHMDRYILLLYPLFAIVAGYGLWTVGGALFARSRFAAYALGVITFGVMTFGVLWFDALLLKNDTRVQAANWIVANVPVGEKVVAFARLLRVPATPEAVTEQRSIDPKSLRSADAALLRLPVKLLPQPRFHALNLFDIDPNFVAVLPEYMQKNDYAYFIYSHEFADGLGAVSLLEGLGENIAAFPGFADNTDDITNGFGGGLRKMFALESNGPSILIKKLDIEQ